MVCIARHASSARRDTPGHEPGPAFMRGGPSAHSRGEYSSRGSTVRESGRFDVRGKLHILIPCRRECLSVVLSPVAQAGDSTTSQAQNVQIGEVMQMQASRSGARHADAGLRDRCLVASWLRQGRDRAATPTPPKEKGDCAAWPRTCDPRKPEVVAAQAYFATRARLTHERGCAPGPREGFPWICRMRGWSPLSAHHIEVIFGRKVVMSKY